VRPCAGPRAAERVALTITYGTGRVSQPMTRAGERWEGTVTAPSAPGSARLEVQIDGAARPLRSRIFWLAP
jgi:hypothetical protein